MSRSWPKRWAGFAGAAVIGLALVPLPAAAAAAPAGQTWAIQPSPNQPGAGASALSGVSCLAGGSCMAVGTYFKGVNSQFPLAMRRSGAKWLLTPVPLIAGVKIGLLSGVSCATTSLCAAVGYTRSTPGNPNTRALVEQWNGTSWARAATPALTGDSLAAVSCPARAFCLAVGSFGAVRASPLAEMWNGKTWRQLAAPSLHAPNGSAFTGVDCLAVNECEIVGSFGYGEGDQIVFAYSYNGKSWIRQKQANRGFEGFVFNADTSVSCTRLTACTSVGFWQPGWTLGQAERWDGTSWQRQHLPKEVSGSLLGVACTAQAACTGVGESSKNLSGTPMSTMALTWNGTSWQREVTPNPAGRSNQLTAVSCTTPTICVAVGESAQSAAAATLVEVSSG